MKKYLKTLFIAMFAIAILYTGKNLTVNAQEIIYNQPYFGVVTEKSGLFIYTAADDKSQTMPIIAQYGWVVDVVGYDGIYSKVCYYNGNINNRAYGYVKTQGMYISKAPTNEKFENLYGYVGVVCYDAVDVRSTTNVKDVFAILPKYSRVTVVGKSANWYKVQVKVNGIVKTGYVYRGLLRVEDGLYKYVSLNYTKTLVRGKQYKINVKDLCPVALGKTVSWKTSNKKVVTISKTGTFKIKKPGKATITCQIKCGSRTRTIRLKLKTYTSYNFSK